MEVYLVNYVDRFLYKLCFLSMVLLCFLGLNHFHVLSISKLQETLSHPMNFMSLMMKLNGKTKLLDLGIDTEVEVSSMGHRLEKIDHGYRIFLDTYEGVENLRLGSVIKIEKKNGYKVYIQSSDNIIYCYTDLSSIDVHLYEIVKMGKIIGNVEETEQKSYCLYMYQGNQYLEE